LGLIRSGLNPKLRLTKSDAVLNRKAVVNREAMAVVSRGVTNECEEPTEIVRLTSEPGTGD